MIDFLKNNPWCSQEQYKWSLTIPQIKLSSFDFSHVETLPERNSGGHTINIESGDDVRNLSDLGIPILG